MNISTNKPSVSDIWLSNDDISNLVTTKKEELAEFYLVSQIEKEWKHGLHVTEVYKRIIDNTYWQIKYRKSSDGETNDFRDGNSEVTQVRPIEVTKIIYKEI